MNGGIKLSFSNQNFSYKKNLYSRPCCLKNKILKYSNQVCNRNIQHVLEEFYLLSHKKKGIVIFLN